MLALTLALISGQPAAPVDPMIRAAVELCPTLAVASDPAAVLNDALAAELGLRAQDVDRQNEWEPDLLLASYADERDWTVEAHAAMGTCIVSGPFGAGLDEIAMAVSSAGWMEVDGVHGGERSWRSIGDPRLELGAAVQGDAAILLVRNTGLVEQMVAEERAAIDAEILSRTPAQAIVFALELACPLLTHPEYAGVADSAITAALEIPAWGEAVTIRHAPSETIVTLGPFDGGPCVVTAEGGDLVGLAQEVEGLLRQSDFGWRPADVADVSFQSTDGDTLLVVLGGDPLIFLTGDGSDIPPR